MLASLAGREYDGAPPQNAEALGGRDSTSCAGSLRISWPTSRGAMHLAHPHKGWENEHLATFLLSRVAFVSSPITVGDDIGTDLLCTLFEAATHNQKPVLLPRSSFAVQVKSNRNPVSISPQLDYLDRLEVPYYLGVVDQNALTLELFSARFLPVVLSLKGPSSRVRLKPTDEFIRDYRPSDDKGVITLLCHKVATLDAHDEAEATSKSAEAIRNDAAAALQAIASRLNKEYLFEITATEMEVIAGPGSAKTFRHSFFKRLAEAYYNFSILVDSGEPVSNAEIDAFLAIADGLGAVCTIPPQVLQLREGLLERRLKRGTT